MRLIIAVLVLFTSFCGCKKSNPELRLRNNNSVVIQSLQVGPLEFENISPGTTSDYSLMPKGTHKISGNTSKGILSGEINISDEVELYTLSLDEDNIIRLTQDR